VGILKEEVREPLLGSGVYMGQRDNRSKLEKVVCVFSLYLFLL